MYGDEVIDIPEDDWQHLLQQTVGKKMQVEVAVWDEKHPDGIGYRPFNISVAKDSIDPWIAYRLIEPGYEAWQLIEIGRRSKTPSTPSILTSTNCPGNISGKGSSCVNLISTCFELM